MPSGQPEKADNVYTEVDEEMQDSSPSQEFLCDSLKDDEVDLTPDQKEFIGI